VQTCLKCGVPTPIDEQDPNAACVHCGAIHARVAQAQALRVRQDYQAAARMARGQRRQRSLWSALAVAPLTMAPIGFVILVMINVGAVVQGIFLSFIAFPILGYLYELVLAIPLFALLNRPEPPSAWAFVMRGCLVGCIPLLFFVFSQPREVGTLAIGSVFFGAILGLILWVLQGGRSS
jgi:hypothetical protein